MEALGAEIEQLKALVQAPPSPPQVIAWDSDTNRDELCRQGFQTMFQACIYPTETNLFI